MKDDRDKVPFFLGNSRAMISLGPLSETKYCTYSCPFCYVDVGFIKYSKLKINDILIWLRENSEKFNIIYISGDTDSFAPPRTDLALMLLDKLTEFKVDLLFTTRTVFNDYELNKIKEINDKLKSQNNVLFGCVSISQLHTPFIEPKPIPHPLERIEQLGKFRQLGIVSVLAMRPFLPIIPYIEYIELIELAKSNTDIILGEWWFSDTKDILENKIIQEKIVEFADYNIEEMVMDFDDNNEKWRVWRNSKIKIIITDKCKQLGLPFFMRSKPAIDWYNKEKRSNK